MNSIENRLEKIKPWLLPFNLILIGMFSFGLGRWSKIEETKTPVLIENPAGEPGANVAPVARLSNGQASLEVSESASTSVTVKTGQLVGSKNGTKYHYPWCSGARRIKEENKIWFSSVNEAKKAGYAPAANCPGL